MSKVQMKLWKNDSPEPEWYNKHSDPLHKTDTFSCEALNQLIVELSGKIKEWLKDKSVDFDAFIVNHRKGWVAKGGSTEIFEQALQQAFIKSDYYRQLMKG